MQRPRLSFVVLLVLAFTVPPAVAHASSWVWPVRGPVIRAFEPPSTPFGAGHRGIDVAVPVETIVRAAAPGVVTFAGAVSGHLFVTVDHGGGIASTDSWVSAIWFTEAKRCLPVRRWRSAGTAIRAKSPRTCTSA